MSKPAEFKPTAEPVSEEVQTENDEAERRINGLNLNPGGVKGWLNGLFNL
ncbi:MAG: hypothetical protein ACK481_03765 [Candidatus Melainabacteria bacterium]